MTLHTDDPTLHAHDQHRQDSLAELLDLDAEVMAGYLTDAITWLATRAIDRPVRILDLGAGTGTGTAALAERFPDTEVVAVDRSEQMLARVRARAAEGALDNRVSTVLADLDETRLPLAEELSTTAGSFDVVWISAALHEFADAGRVLDGLLPLLRPGGVLMVVEIDGPPRFLTDAVGDGLEARLHQALHRERPTANHYPDWSGHLEHAGFTAVQKATFSVDRPIEADGIGGRYARTYLRRIQPVVGPGLSEPDRVLLEQLLAEDGPTSLLHRDDLRLRGGRTAWAAYRPH